MTDRSSPLSDLDLHAYVDDRLDGDRRAEFEALLAGDPDSRSRVEDYKAQTGALHDLFDGVLDEPAPAALVESATAALAGAPRRSRRSLIASLAAAIALFLVGGGIGWFAHDMVVRDGPGPAILAPLATDTETASTRPCTVPAISANSAVILPMTTSSAPTLTLRPRTSPPTSPSMRTSPTPVKPPPTFMSALMKVDWDPVAGILPTGIFEGDSWRSDFKKNDIYEFTGVSHRIDFAA